MECTSRSGRPRRARRSAELATLVALLSIVGLTPVAAAPVRPSAQPATHSLSAPGPSSVQVVTVGAPAGFTYAAVSLWQRQSTGHWTRLVGPISARVGSNGIGAAHEGSRFTPAGTFALDQAFGRVTNPGTRLPYFKTDRYDWWDENPSSPTYNLHVRRSTSPGGASENLYYAGAAYNMAVNMAYNPTRIPGKGSAFFLHVRGASATAGCVSIAPTPLLTILRTLNPALHPVIDVRVGSPWWPPS